MSMLADMRKAADSLGLPGNSTLTAIFKDAAANYGLELSMESEFGWATRNFKLLHSFL